MLELKDQLCSVEPARKLKELGIEQDGIWVWFYNIFTCEMYLRKYEKDLLSQCLEKKDNMDCVSAFTVAELGERLPQEIWVDEENVFYLRIMKNHGNSMIGYMRQDPQEGWNWESYISFEEDNEADARANMLIYLLENKLTSVKNKKREDFKL